jgi:hypothetical protein
MSIGEFLSSDNRVLQLQMVDVDEWTGLIKVFQVLQKNNCLTEGQYSVLKLKRLLAVNHLMDLSALWLSTKTNHLILMSCEKNHLLNEETKGLIEKLFNSVKQKLNAKIILSTRSDSTTIPSLQEVGTKIFGKEFVTRVEWLAWSDITRSFQEKLLEQSVKFQGANVSLNKLMSAESPAAKYLPLGALLGKREIKIADPVPISKAYNEVSYIGRTLCHQKAIKQDIFSDKDVKDFHVYLANTEEDFRHLCELHPNGDVHWLERDASGKLVWQQTQGSLEKLREYTDNGFSHTYTDDDLVKLLEEAQRQRVMVISDTAGMGKSTVLTHISKEVKRISPAKWVVRIDLNDHTDVLQTLKLGQMDKGKVIEFVSEKVLKLKSGLEMELFKQCCYREQNLGVVMMIDGFDEISPLYKETVIHLVQVLRQTALEQLWVTTRPHLRRVLEDKLQQLSYTIEPFPEENQVEFLTKFWSLRDWFTRMDSKGKAESKKKLEIYAEKLIKKLSQSVSDKDKEFTSSPLQCRMLAEEFDEKVKTFCKSAESMPQLPTKLDLLGLYERFIDRKYDIYQGEKFRVQANNIIAREQRERDLKCMRRDHQLLALKVLFTEEQVAVLQGYNKFMLSREELARFGIAEVNYDSKLHFIHGTFAEYYVADFFVNQLTGGSRSSPKLQDYLLKYIFVKEDYRLIRRFIDGLMSRSELSEEVLKQYGNRICDLREDGVLILYKAAREDSAHIVGFLFKSLHAAEHTDTLIRLLLAQDNNTQTAWHLAAVCGNIQVLQKLWEWAKEKLTTEDLNNKLLLAKDKRGQTAWHVAAECDNLQLLQKLWEWAKEKLTTDDLSNKLLLAKDVRERTTWHVAAERGNLELLQRLWEWAKEVLTAEVMSDELLLARDDNEQTFLHVAAKKNCTKEFEKVWDWATEKLSPEEIKKLLLAKDSHELTVSHMGANKFTPKLLEELLNWAT